MAREDGSVRIARNGFRDITASLRAKIEQGEIVSGAYLPTERELQVAFGASRATVRKSLAALIDAGWAFNVPNRGVVATRGLKPGHTSQVGFIHTDDFPLDRLSDGLALLLEERGFELVHLPGRVNQPMERGIRVASEANFAGALVWSYRGFVESESVLKAAGSLPIVALDHRLGAHETDLVTFDHECAAMEATEELIRLGCRRIGVTGMLDMLDATHQRFSGYMRALFRNGLQPNPCDYVFTYTSGMDAPDTRLFEARLRSPEPPDGFLVLQDLFVSSAAEAAARAGLRLPDDLKLATVGIDLGTDVNDLVVAFVALDSESCARQAVELLLERLENLHCPPQVRIAPHRLRVTDGRIHCFNRSSTEKPLYEKSIHAH